MSCTTPIDDVRLVDYWAGDLPVDEAEAIENHVFGCVSCTQASAKIAAIASALRGMLPTAVSRAQVDALRAQGLSLVETSIPAGVPTTVTFARHVDLMIHRLAGLALEGTERVHVTVRVASTGAVLTEDPLAAFDAARGEVLIACQRHFAVFPHDIEIEVRAHRPGIAPTETVYSIPHVFET